MQIRTIEADGCQIRVDLGSQVLGIEIPEDTEYGDVAGRLETPLLGSVAGLGRGLVSASVLAQKAKTFDDGLFAAVELAAQEGAGEFGGKKRLLTLLADILKDGGAGQPGDVVLAATALGMGGHDTQNDVAERIKAATDTFLADELRSKPIGFYTWSEALGNIFRQDRMLQTELEGAQGIERLAHALGMDDGIRGIYEKTLELAWRLTNPSAFGSLLSLLQEHRKGNFETPSKGVRFLPPSLAYETELVKRLYENQPIPDGFDLAAEMVGWIRAGELDLAPRPSSGWYDYVTWALEPLVVPDRMPEASRLRLGRRYRKELIELFKGILALARETHVKQLEIPFPGAAEMPPSVDVHPELSAEPLPSHYARRAEAYRFVRQVLKGVFGAGALETTHRQTPDGPVVPSLGEELAAMVDLFDGAGYVVARQLGDERSETEEETRQAVAFTRWAEDWRADPDLTRDARMMVPVFYDVQRMKTKVWVFLGWTEKPVDVWFHRKPSYRVTDSRGAEVPDDKRPLVTFESTRHRLVYPVTAEVYVQRILDRDEFRQLCDRHRTKTNILAVLA